ncbi:MAG: DUF4280 domain-containing protein [Lachnospiraceae bacterium]|nr:DUF4280 domain-containing protein [Lachnospiraceae bacterium]
MSNVEVMTAQTQCTMGTAPAPLKVTSNQMVLADNKPIATIRDGQAMANVGPYGMCTSMANPQVAAATAAKFGTLTPMPCVPVTGAWVPNNPKLLIAGTPCLTKDDQMPCAYGGMISVVAPGQVKVNL